jgi:alkylated DNA nucleotide flippase Atl1
MSTRRGTDAFEEVASGGGAAAFARRVLEVVEAIPRVRVMAYGDVAKCVGGGARQVAKVMATQGDEAPWWRVLRADGTCAPGVKTQQVKRLRAEGVAFKGVGRVDMAKARWVVED